MKITRELRLSLKPIARDFNVKLNLFIRNGRDVYPQSPLTTKVTSTSDLAVHLSNLNINVRVNIAGWNNNCPMILGQASIVYNDFCLARRLAKCEYVPFVVGLVSETIRHSDNATNVQTILVPRKESRCCVVCPQAFEFWLERATLFRAGLNYNRPANSLPDTLPKFSGLSWEWLRFRSNELV